jgi:cation diffusion facilitator family transporter
VPARSESKTVVYAALAGNGLIAVTKLAAGLFTGSSAMLSEAIHSTVDMGNQGLMIHGIARSKQPPDQQHPFGHGLELYFWSFVVALLIFGLGAGMSFYEGIEKLLNPHPVTGFVANYVVLGSSVLFEGISWTIALRQFNKARAERNIMDAVHASKDPTIFTVLFEDSAALIGLAIAFAGLLSVQFLGLVWADAAASMIIGLVLAVTAVILAVETKSLLTGEAASAAVTREIRKIILEAPAVQAVGDLRTIHFGPNNILATVCLEFAAGANLETVQETADRLERKIKERLPAVRRFYIETRTTRPSLA